jgi:crossover junction endonuclease MUS81
VARKKPAHRLGDHDDIEEVVLDLVVERKTEDDLIHSIVDGRFMEQKFRLNSAAIGQCIYLVERFEGTDFERLGMDKFQAAIWHTQIIDGLSLRYTANLEDSLRFICALHAHIVSQYENQTLHLALCSDVGHVQRSEFMSSLHRLSQEDKYHYLMSYGLYSHLNSKSGTLTLRDVFIKMLMSVRGMTAEKALMIVEKFPTPFLYISISLILCICFICVLGYWSIIGGCRMTMPGGSTSRSGATASTGGSLARSSPGGSSSSSGSDHTRLLEYNY